MNQRYLIVILSLFISLGAFAHPAGATDCDFASTCIPMQGTAHSTGGHINHCSCNLLRTPSGHTCRLEGLLERFQRAIGPPAAKRPGLTALGLAAVRWGRIPRLEHRELLPQRFNRSNSPLSYPIYLQTLALLC